MIQVVFRGFVSVTTPLNGNMALKTSNLRYGCDTQIGEAASPIIHEAANPLQCQAQEQDIAVSPYPASQSKELIAATSGDILSEAVKVGSSGKFSRLLSGE